MYQTRSLEQLSKECVINNVETENSIDQLPVPTVIKQKLSETWIDINNVNNEFSPYSELNLNEMESDTEPCEDNVEYEMESKNEPHSSNAERFRRSRVINKRFHKLLSIKYKNEKNTYTDDEMEEIVPLRVMYYSTSDWDQGAVSEFLKFRRQWMFPILYSQVRGGYLPGWDQWECFGMIKSEITIREFLSHISIKNPRCYNYVDAKGKLWLSFDVIEVFHFAPYAQTPENDNTDDEYECTTIESSEEIVKIIRDMKN